MPNNPLIEAFRQIVGSPETGRGLFSPQNIMDALKLTGQQYTGKAPLEPSLGMPGSPVQIPQMDLGRITVQAPQQPQMPLPPMNIASPMENMGLARPQGQPKPQGNGINWQMLMDIGIPALSAIIGTAAPGTLAGASGLSTGYTGAREKQRERQFELDKEEKKRQIEAEEIAKPTFGQKGKIEALKTGLKQGKIVIGKEFGEPQVYDVNKEGLEGALLAIQNAGLDPALFEAELTPYASQYASEYEKLIKSKNPKDLERARQLRDTLLSLPFVKEE